MGLLDNIFKKNEKPYQDIPDFDIDETCFPSEAIAFRKTESEYWRKHNSLKRGETISPQVMERAQSTFIRNLFSMIDEAHDAAHQYLNRIEDVPLDERLYNNRQEARNAALINVSHAIKTALDPESALQGVDNRENLLPDEAHLPEKIRETFPQAPSACLAELNKLQSMHMMLQEEAQLSEAFGQSEAYQKARSDIDEKIHAAVDKLGREMGNGQGQLMNDLYPEINTIYERVDTQKLQDAAAHINTLNISGGISKGTTVEGQPLGVASGGVKQKTQSGLPGH